MKLYQVVIVMVVLLVAGIMSYTGMGDYLHSLPITHSNLFYVIASGLAVGTLVTAVSSK